MVYSNSVSPLSYKSVLMFTIDGRPSVEDIHSLFFTLMSQINFSVHRHMFRNYVNTFSSEEAIVEIASLNISSAAAARATSSSALKIERDMAKALIQQFLWTRLIENAVEPHNRTYRDKGIWKLKEKGLCVLQYYCINTNTTELLEQFKQCVDQTTVEPMFLIYIERVGENDRMNNKRKYITSLFAIMIASLPLRNDNNSKNSSSASPLQHYPNRKPPMHNPIGFSSPNYIRKISIISDKPCPFYENSLSRHASISSADSGSTCSTSSSREGKSITDYFPHLKILPNDLLIPVSPHQKATGNILFQQQKTLLHNLNPSSSNKFRMRSVFTSALCCNWLVEFCTVASNDEAESIMTEFLNLGWITFYDEKHKYNDQVESSKSVALKLTGTGMKIVIDVSLEQYTDFQQTQQPKESVMNNLDTRYSVASSGSSNYTASTAPSSIMSNCEEPPPISRSPLLSLRNSCQAKNNDSFTPIYNTPHQHHIYEAGYSDYDGVPPPLITPYVENITKLHYSNSTAADSNNTPPFTPTTLGGDSIKETNSIKLKAILKDTKLRTLFRNFLAINLCVENLDFWVDHNHLRRNCHKNPTLLAMMSPTKQQQILQEAYILWDTYLSLGASRELNIDHTLREDMAEEISQMVTLITAGTGESIMTKVIISTHSEYESLLTLLNWFDRVNDQIFKLMTTDSVPKFIRTTEYKMTVQSYDREEEIAASMTNSDLDDFPPPPQRKLKETLFL
ncbi:hypothetical protein INT48_004727 [Thamnidium elegans]|uniref:RGS domain-containing protein n=1 Tax=Thamnidium elegans TaxID=101142 RepID=A0A8H7SVJ7_9FUNG|nr:hypothetical protein INT48_004727 [Thamnidium elegans]